MSVRVCALAAAAMLLAFAACGRFDTGAGATSNADDGGSPGVADDAGPMLPSSPADAGGVLGPGCPVVGVGKAFCEDFDTPALSSAVTVAGDKSLVRLDAGPPASPPRAMSARIVKGSGGRLTTKDFDVTGKTSIAVELDLHVLELPTSGSVDLVTIDTGGDNDSNTLVVLAVKPGGSVFEIDADGSGDPPLVDIDLPPLVVGKWVHVRIAVGLRRDGATLAELELDHVAAFPKASVAGKKTVVKDAAKTGVLFGPNNTSSGASAAALYDNLVVELK